MPRRAATKNSIKNRPICKSAGLGGYLGSHIMKRCKNLNRVGLVQGARDCLNSKTKVGKDGNKGIYRPCGKN